MRRGWRDPVVRQRMVEGMRRAARTTEGREARRRNWLDPVTRQRMVDGIRRSLNTPESRRKRSDWSPEARQEKGEFMRRLWRERREGFLSAMRRPDFRKGRSDFARARWADPVSRGRLLAALRSPEARQRKSLRMRRYFRECPRGRACRVLWGACRKVVQAPKGGRREDHAA